MNTRQKRLGSRTRREELSLEDYDARAAELAQSLEKLRLWFGGNGR